MPIEPSHPLVDIKDAVSDFVARESELAAAELKPAAKAASSGAGYFAGAAVFAFHAIWMLVILIALAVGLLLYAVTPIGPWGSFTLGFLVSMVLSVVATLAMVVRGRNKFRQVKMPEATLAEAKATLDAVLAAVTARRSGSDATIRPGDLPRFRDADLSGPDARP